LSTFVNRYYAETFLLAEFCFGYATLAITKPYRFQGLVLEMSFQEMQARLRARELVNEIANEHGHVGEDVLRQINDPEVRDRILKALNTKDGMIGSTVITYGVRSSDDLIRTLTGDDQAGQKHLHKQLSLCLRIAPECGRQPIQQNHWCSFHIVPCAP
jgi:hypothetical protein